MTQVDLQLTPDGARVEIRGRLTMDDGLIALRDTLWELTRLRTPKVVVDLQAVSYLDSAALGELISGCRRIRDVGGQLELVRPSERVASLLRMTRLDRLLMPRRSSEPETSVP